MAIYSGDTFSVSGGNSPVIGDAEVLGFGEVGGDDAFYGVEGGSGYVAFGDGFVLEATALGGNDYFSGGAYVSGGAFVPASVSIAAPLPFFFSGGVQFAGDAAQMSDQSQGGDDFMLGGYDSDNVLVGDASDSMTGRSHGGGDEIHGGISEDDNTTDLLLGDAYAFGTSVFAPVSTSSVHGSALHGSAFGPSSRAGVIGGDDEIFGGAADGVTLATYKSSIMGGDAYALGSSSRGGSDYMSGGEATVDSVSGGADAQAGNFMAGDGYVMTGSSIGGADDMVGGSANQWGTNGDAYAINLMAGDAFLMAGNARGGSDEMYGGDSHAQGGYSDGMGALTLNFMAGDGFMIQGAVSMGSDYLSGGSGDWGTDGYALNVMYGDVGSTDFLSIPFFGTSSASLSPIGGELEAFAADSLRVSSSSGSRSGQPRFGNDTIVGGDGQAENYMVGDAHDLPAGAKAGDDTIVGGGWGSINTLVGDADIIEWGARGGRDVLLSGEGDDQMYGDAYDVMDGKGGADRFVFAPGNGNDTIYDFRVSDRDRIDLHALGDNPDFRSFSSLMASGRVDDGPDGVVIFLDDIRRDVSSEVRGDTVTIVGVHEDELKASMFIF